MAADTANDIQSLSVIGFQESSASDFEDKNDTGENAYIKSFRS